MRHSILQNMIESKNNNYTIYEKENNTWLSDDHGVIAWGNIGMTITHPQEYYDIDEYLETGKVIPGFQNAKKHNLFEECCGYACMNWYKEWYLKQNTTGIKQLETQADVVSTLYYNIEGKEVEKPTAGVYIIKQLLSNGKIRSRKVFLK